MMNASERARAHLLWATISLLLLVTFGYTTTACRRPALTFSAAIHFAMKPSAPYSAVLRHKTWSNDYSDLHFVSLPNLVSGYECGRVFPAGVGPGSPSRDAANWLPSRFCLSVETRRQYGWLRMVFSGGVRLLFRVPIWWPSGGWRHARGREHCRGEPGSFLSGGYAPDSTKAEGSSNVDEPGERENRKREPGDF